MTTRTCDGWKCEATATHRRIVTDPTTGRVLVRDDLCPACARAARVREGKSGERAVREVNGAVFWSAWRTVTHASLRRAWERAVASGDERAIADAERDGWGL